MIRQSIFLSYTLQLFIINLHIYPNTRHVYMILFGILLHKITARIFYTRLRYLVGCILILAYLQYPFLYFLSYSYIICNTYFSISQLVQSVNNSSKIYSLEIISCILSFIVHVDYSIIYVLCMLDGFLIYFRTCPPTEYKDLQKVLSTIGFIVVDDYNLKKEEYKFALNSRTFFNIYDERQNKANEYEHVIDENYNVLQEKEEQINYEKPEPKISIDVFTPLILAQRNMYSLLLMIFRLLPFQKYYLLSYIFIFLYYIDHKLISLLISIFCKNINIKNISSRMISIVVIYYILDL